MKKSALFFALTYFLLIPFSCFGQTNEISIYLNDKQFFTEYKTIIQHGRLMFSLRDIGRLINSDVVWQEEQNMAVVSNEKQRISFALNQQAVLIEEDGFTDVKKMDTRPIIVNERMYIPVRVVSEISGFQVFWNSEHNQVHITSSSSTEDKEKPIRIVKIASKAENSSTMISPAVPVSYSPVSQNLEEIISYIKNNIDENFDVNNFEVRTNMSSNIVAGEICSTSISMKLRKGDFIYEDGYRININNGFVDTILIMGSPFASSHISETELVGGIDPKWLVNLAMENINIPKGYDVVEQTIFEKYDGELYYDVRIEFESFHGFGHVESYEYRI